MAVRLKVGGVDLSEYLRLQPEDGLDIFDSSFLRPQFAGAAALGEGQTWTSDATDNRTINVPLYLTGATRAAVKKQGQEIEAVLVKGSQVEFCIDPSIEESTFFDLERGVLGEEFNYFYSINSVQSATLTLVCRPYGNTATHRLIASIPQGSAAAFDFSATGLAGDEYALANFEVKVGSQAASNGRVIAWGVHPHPSHLGYRQANLESGGGRAQASSVIANSPTAIGSYYAKIPISPTGASGISYTQFLNPNDAHIGRHRVFAIGRSGLVGQLALYAEDHFGAILGATALATQTDQGKWQLIDLGEINVPARASGQEPVPTQYVVIRAGGVSGNSINASPAFHLNGLVFLPLDYSAGILRTPGAGGNALAMRDGFGRMEGANISADKDLESLPVADTGQRWRHLGGDLGEPFFSNYFAIPGKVTPVAEGALGGTNEAKIVKANASGLFALASGSLYGDVLGQIDIALGGGGPSVTSPSAVARFWPKAQTNATAIIGGVGVEFRAGPSQALSLWAASSNGATSLVASAGIASTLASGIYQGQTHTLTVSVRSGLANVWLATGVPGASPILSASRAEFTGQGWPVIGANQGTNVSEGAITLDNFRLYQLSAEAGDIAGREAFRFEAHPQGRVYQGNASVFIADRLANYRGQFPKIPNVGSPMATGPAKVVVLQGEIDNFFGSDGMDISLAVLERFRFLR